MIKTKALGMLAVLGITAAACSFTLTAKQLGNRSSIAQRLAPNSCRLEMTLTAGRTERRRARRYRREEAS